MISPERSLKTGGEGNGRIQAVYSGLMGYIASPGRCSENASELRNPQRNCNAVFEDDASGTIMIQIEFASR